MNDKKEMKLPYFELTREILRCCFEVMKELGPKLSGERLQKRSFNCDERTKIASRTRTVF
jgi:hypothetical protein